MDEAWFADRVRLYQLWQAHPDWTTPQFAVDLGRTRSWVAKWLRRFQTATARDPAVICASRSCARQHPSPPLNAVVITRILELRDDLARTFNRVVGAKTILWYLHQDPTLADERLPTSPTTIWKVLDQHQRIVRRRRRPRKPVERPAPLAEFELDFTDITTIPGDPDTKLTHAAEVFNWVDRGTSIPVASRVSADFHAASVIEACAAIIHDLGLPQRIRCDRDPRFVGNARTDDFPSPFMRLWMNLGVAIDLCPPQRPDLKPFVERYNKSVQEECITKEHPTTVGTAQASVEQYRRWYCAERPHQGDACQNQPPAVAFPQLPALPAVPLVVDAAGWLTHIDGQPYVRKVSTGGRVSVDGVHYHIGLPLKGQEVTLVVCAATREFRVLHRAQEVKRLAIQQVVTAVLPFAEMITQLCQLADRESARLNARTKRRTTQQRPQGR